jgi:hypothetical protein
MNASPALRLLTAAVSPRTHADLARLRPPEARLATARVRPMVVVVLGINPKAGTSTVASLVARLLHGLAPGQVAVLDGDGVTQPQRLKLAADGGGDLRELLATRQDWQARRGVERYLARASVPLLSMAAHRELPIPLVEIDTAVTLLRRRFPIVVVDLPPSHEPRYQWAGRVADQLILVGAEGDALAAAQASLTAGGRNVQVVVACRTIPRDQELAQPGPARLDRLRHTTLTAAERIITNILDE